MSIAYCPSKAMPLRFASSEAERAFQLHYGALPVALGLITVVLGACIHVAFFYRSMQLTAASPTPAFNTQQTVLSLASIILYLGHYALLGKQKFILSRGFHSVWHRVLHATGLLSWIKPSGCAAAGYCQLLLQHRLFLVHFVGAVTRMPSGWYWSGGVLSWLAMAAVDVVDFNGGCGQSPACLVSALQAHAAEGKWLLLQNIIMTTLRSSRVFAVDVVLPGLLLTWLELRARRAWWQQQQARQQEVLLQLRREAAAHKQEQQVAAASKADCGSSKEAAATAPPPPQTGQPLQQQPQHVASITVAAKVISQGVLCAVGAPARNTTSARAAAAAAGPAAATHGTLYSSEQRPAVPLPAVTCAHHSAAAPATAPAGSLAPLAAPTAAAAGVALPAAAAQVASHPLLYRSPVGRRVVSFKFAAAPGGTQDSARFGQQLAGAAQAAAQVALTALEVQAANAAAGAHNAPPVLATDFAAFPGCYQIVLHLISALDEEPQQQHESAEQQLRQSLLAAAQAVAAGWPSCGGLLSMQLCQQQQQGTVQLSSFPVAAVSAGLQKRLVAAAAAAAAAPLGYAETEVVDSLASLTGREAAAAGMYLQPVVLPGSVPSSSSNSSSSSGSADEPVAMLCMTQAAARQHSLRVVVTAAASTSSVIAGSTAAAGLLLLDQTWQLQNIAAGTGVDACRPLQLQLPSGQQPHALAVTVLTDNQAASLPTSYQPAAVIAKLPLLVLPTCPAAELQQLFAGMVEEGLPPAAAYQEVLPLLQDLAAVLLAAEHGTVTKQHQLHLAMQEALAECFAAHDLVACQELLLQAARPDCTAAVVVTPLQAAAALASPPPAAATDAGLTSDSVGSKETGCETKLLKQQQQCQWQQQQQQHCPLDR